MVLSNMDAIVWQIVMRYFLVAERISKQQSGEVGATRDWLSLDTKSETD